MQVFLIIYNNRIGSRNENLNWDIYFNAGKTTVFRMGQSTISYSDQNIAANQWTHIAMTRNTSGASTTYINGIKLGTTTIAIPTGTSTITILGKTLKGNAYSIQGYLAQMQIYDKAKTAEEIQEIYSYTEK